MRAGILISYFAKRDAARRALKVLQWRGFRRVALVTKTADGHIQTHEPFLRFRTLVVTAAFFLLGIIAEAAAMNLQWPVPVPMPIGNLAALLPGGRREFLY